ncbi:MAG: hypothetical protein ACE5EU_02685 [Paracoccaceae bacterium]
MTAAVDTAPAFAIPGRTFRGALIALLVAALTVGVLTGRGEATSCQGAPLAVADATLPDLTHPA